jgi:hypothetical protein
MMDAKQLLTHIIRPVLKDLDLWSEPAERLILGTACQESACGQYIVQLGDVVGGGLGIYQMEPGMTGHDDCWHNFLVFRPELSRLVKLQMINPDNPTAEEMIGNAFYATAMCRIKYLRVPEPIPDYLGAQAAYWKKYYNTEAGAGTVQQYMNNWNRYVTAGVV